MTNLVIATFTSDLITPPKNLTAETGEMNLTDREKEQLKAMIDRGEPLPAKYKLSLFADASQAELIWQGKTNEVTNVVLPFQSIEQIDEPRSELNGGQQLDFFAVDAQSRRQSSGWSNKLIWGDNKLVLASLKNGPLRREIEAAGGLKLIYIDPPFDTGADFSINIEIGDETLTKEPSVIEEIAYRDTWGRGTNSYISMMYERLNLMRDLLADDGSIYVHCDSRINGVVRLALDEVFGKQKFINEISWKRSTNTSSIGQIWKRSHDSVLFYAKSEEYIFNFQYKPLSETSRELYQNKDERGYYQLVPVLVSGKRTGSTGQPWRGIDPNKRGKAGMHWITTPENLEKRFAEGLVVFPVKEGGVPRLKYYLLDNKGVVVSDLWDDINLISSSSTESLNYPTQKPEALLNRIIRASSNEGDLVADFFCGSGTTMAVAENLGRKWIGCDIGRYAIHISRKRLIRVQRQLKAGGKLYRSFEILNLGKYDRQAFVGINPNLPEEERRIQAVRKEEHYLMLILSAYKAERVFQLPQFHGKKGKTLVVVGPVDAPVTLSQLHEIVTECQKQWFTQVDILGFEFEMGTLPYARDEARAKGISVGLKYIPKDVFDKRAVEKGQVKFYDIAYVEVQPKVEGQTVKVELKDFAVYYRQDDLDVVGEKLKNGGNKVTVENGQVMKISKDKKGIVTREVLTKQWTDWIDYWAVDFNFESKLEIITVLRDDGRERQVRTGNYIFENEWQSFRPRCVGTASAKQTRTLELVSVPHKYPKRGRYKIAVKVIDIFGNDTTKVVEVTV